MMKTPQEIDICYVISHGFAARMLLQTGLLKQLAELDYKIAIILPDVTDENFIELAQHQNIFLIDPEIKLKIWDDDYGFKRKYYLEDLKSNPVFWEKHLYSLLYSDSKHPWKRVRPLYYYFIYQLIRVFPGIRERFIRNEHRHLHSDKAIKLIAQLKPKMLVSTYPPNFLESKFSYAAKVNGVTTVTHLLSWDNITSKGIFSVIPDYFIAWGQVMSDELKDYYQTSEDQVFICGVPHFDQHFQVKESPEYRPILEELDLNPSKPYLFFGMSSPRITPYEVEIVEWLAQKIEADEFGTEMQLVIRPHPQNVTGSFAKSSWNRRLQAKKTKRVALDMPQLIESGLRWSMKSQDMNRLANLIHGCRICLNSGSTIAIDALIHDRPVIFTAFDGNRKVGYWKSARRLADYIHLKKLVELGGMEVVSSYKEMTNLIHHFLNHPEEDLHRRKQALHQQCHIQDGNATNRVLKVTTALLDRINLQSR